MQNQKANFENMNTLSSLTETAFNKGYTDNFRVEGKGMYAPATDIHYLPNEVKIDNFYRFEGASDPEDSSILYCIETHDGVKGTLVDAYGVNADELITAFIKQVEEIQKAEAVK